MRLMGIVVVLAACGDDPNNRKIMDAPAVGHDEGVFDSAQPNPVTVTVKNQPGPTQNVEVYFQNADSTLVATAHTDANGVASQVMDAGGFVTLVNPYPLGKGGNQLVTWAGVKPGDRLVLDNSSVQMAATVTFHLPLDTGHGTVSSYTLYATCESNTLSFSTPNGTGISTVDQQWSLNACGGTADVMLVASDMNNQPLSYFYVPAQPITDGDTIDYSAKTFTAAVQRTFEFDNNPNANNPITIGDQFVTSRGQVFQESLGVGGTTVMTSFGEPALPTGSLDVVTTQQTVANTNRNTVAWGLTAAAYTVDYSASVVGDFTVDPSLDTGTHAISWTLGAGKAAQFAIGSISVSRAAATSWQWQIVGPSATQLQLPTLPTDVADFTIVATDSFTVYGVGAGFVPGGYDAFRATAFGGPPGVIGTTGIAGYNLWQQILTATALIKQTGASKLAIAPRGAWQKR